MPDPTFDPDAVLKRLGDRRLSVLKPEDEPGYVVHGLPWLRHGRRTLLVGREGSGKSTLARQVVAAGSVVKHWIAADSWTAPRTPVDNVRTLWISGDETVGRIARAFKRFDPEWGDIAVEGIHAFVCDDFAGPDALHAVVWEYRPHLIVVDPVLLLVRPEREAYQEIYTAVNQWFPGGCTT